MKHVLRSMAIRTAHRHDTEYCACVRMPMEKFEIDVCWYCVELVLNLATTEACDFIALVHRTIQCGS